MMGNLGVLACGMVLLAAAGLAAPAPPPVPVDPCGVLAAVDEARALVQDDGGSGRDAGDCSERALPSYDEGYVWGHVDPAGAAGVADLDDWFTVDVAALIGMGSPAMVNLTADVVGYTLDYYTPLPSLRGPGPVLHMDLHPPGGGAPMTISTCSDGALFTVASQGDWRLHVYRLAIAPGTVPLEAPCTPPALLKPPETPAPMGQTYGFYLGCHPHCVVVGE